MKTIELTSKNFEQVLAENETVLCDFWAPWCGPCRMVSPIIDEIASQRADIAVGKVNCDEQGVLAQRFGVMSIPTVIVFKNGAEAQRTIGARSKEEYIKLI